MLGHLSIGVRDLGRAGRLYDGRHVTRVNSMSYYWDMETQFIPQETAAVLSELASRYFWWEPVSGHSHSLSRKIAQIMHLGTYEDIRRLEVLVGEAVLAETMRSSQPGWFDDRSWDFWRGRLLALGEADIPERRPARGFVHATLF